MMRPRGAMRWVVGAIWLLASCGRPVDQPWTLTLTRIAGGFTNPTTLVAAPDGSGRLFVTAQTGTIRIVDPAGGVRGRLFLDLADRMRRPLAVYDEGGLLGLAFHPLFADNGRFFVYYTAPPDVATPPGYYATAYLSEFVVDPDDPDRADPDSEQVLLAVPQPQTNHNGGQLAFGPDGCLYAGIGDGGGANDVGFGHTAGIGNAQDLTNVLGTIVRLDVTVPGVAAIPADNPFVGDSQARPEIFAYGFRNPWRFSFDREGGQLLCADVGQSLYEEINRVIAGGNYGWNIREGPVCFDPQNATRPLPDCADAGYRGEPLQDPVIWYAHPGADAALVGRSVVGGYRYRGTALPALRGSFVTGDWSRSFVVPTGALLVAQETAPGQWQVEPAAVRRGLCTRPDLGCFLLGFGEDTAGELYVLTSDSLGPVGRSGTVYRITGAVRQAH